jgi:hypothetical protein
MTGYCLSKVWGIQKFAISRPMADGGAPRPCRRALELPSPAGAKPAPPHPPAGRTGSGGYGLAAGASARIRSREPSQAVGSRQSLPGSGRRQPNHPGTAKIASHAVKQPLRLIPVRMHRPLDPGSSFERHCCGDFEPSVANGLQFLRLPFPGGLYHIPTVLPFMICSRTPGG